MTRALRLPIGTWLPGTPLDAANLNWAIRDNLEFMQSPPYCYLTRTAAQGTTSGVTATVLWDSEVEDVDGMHDNVTNPERMTCKVAGLYHVVVNLLFVTNVTGERWIELRNQAGTLIGHAGTGAATLAGGSTIMVIDKEVRMKVNDYLYVQAHQNSGGALNLGVGNGDPAFQAIWTRA